MTAEKSAIQYHFDWLPGGPDLGPKRVLKSRVNPDFISTCFIREQKVPFYAVEAIFSNFRQCGFNSSGGVVLKIYPAKVEYLKSL